MISQSVIARLKTVDPDRYRAALFAPPTDRHRLLCLYAFHAELAKVPELVSDPMVGQIRYQWWRDCVDEIYKGGSVRAHEVSTPLTEMLRAVEMPRFWVDQLIDGRARDLDPTPFATIDAARDYSRQTSGVLMQMAVHCLGSPTEGAETESREAGTAWGLTGLARGYGFYKDSMLSQIEFGTICDAAQAGYQSARTALRGVSADLIPAIAYAALIPGYIKKLTSSRHDFAQEIVQYGPMRKHWKLIASVLRGSI